MNENINQETIAAVLGLPYIDEEYDKTLTRLANTPEEADRVLNAIIDNDIRNALRAAINEKII